MRVWIQIYYSIIYPFLTYGVILLQSLTILQKKAIRIMNFSHFRAPSSPIFKQLFLLKFSDIVQFCTAIFMHQYHYGNFPAIFTEFFTEHKHKYNTRLSSKCALTLPRVRTNYGSFNIRFCGSKVWNSVDECLKLFGEELFRRD